MSRLGAKIEAWIPWVISVLAAVIVAAAVSFFVVRGGPTTEDLSNLNETIETQAELIDEANETLAEERKARTALEGQIRALGKKPDLPPATRTSPFIPVPGDKGEKGEKGDSGEPGESIIGPEGPRGPMFPIEQARQILQGFFNTFCAENDCVPEDGADGRGIQRVTCNVANRFVMHYTDGTSQVVEQSQCRRVLVATPQEEED